MKCIILLLLSPFAILGQCEDKFDEKGNSELITLQDMSITFDKNNMYIMLHKDQCVDHNQVMITTDEGKEVIAKSTFKYNCQGIYELPYNSIKSLNSKIIKSIGVSYLNEGVEADNVDTDTAFDIILMMNCLFMIDLTK